MQKKLIALAIAGLVSAPAFAQSNVTIYGVADAYVGFGKHGENDLRGVNSGALSGSRLGFRGTEDLGNGLKAVFVLEQGINIDEGSGSGYQRQAFVGLGGSFGTVALGRQYAPGYFFQYDGLGGAAVGPQSILSNYAGLTITPNTPARWNNSVTYTGTFSGLTARAIYSAQGVEVDENPSDDDAYGFGLDYSNGPLKVSGVYQVAKYDFAAAPNDEKQKEWGLGASYNFGVVALSASYQSGDNVQGVKDRDADLWTVGLAVPVGAAGSIHLAYAEVEFDRPAGASDTEVKSYTLAYTHALSKRTTAYVAFNRTDNDNAETAGLVGYGHKAGSTFGGENSDLLGVGIRHTF
ncbi:porin [Thauera linaloolentis]|uniref:Porin n=1 Tax=Thauera linaloolentis (strain DSM 12138 / JCM 21573 / CCUG 41526 / CIP 105981 / IAM 15112 / NBRC 102519 / 47Lol) TaxID=1123367 RepID=N6YVH1_THAL4|nr:porin [Thauera linaloolentis]ENO86392.1 porin [Thauera linaloolentis 47Lol = DSM 12138]MCM8564205.1 porin [Thauera linaloolentis]